MNLDNLAGVVEVYAGDTKLAHLDQWHSKPRSIATFLQWLDVFMEVECSGHTDTDTNPSYGSVTNSLCGLYPIGNDPTAPALQDRDQQEPVPIAHYQLLTRPDRRPIRYKLLDRPRYIRSCSHNSESTTPSRPSSFARQVKERDGVTCCVTGSRLLPGRPDLTVMMHVAHIVPRTVYKDLDQYGGDRLCPERHPTNMDDIRNGLTLQMNVHTLWDYYLITVDPRNFRVIDFGGYGHEGRTLTLNGVPGVTMPSEDFLKWHFEQAILANVKVHTDTDLLTPEEKDDPEYVRYHFDRKLDDLSEVEIWANEKRGKQVVENYLSMRLAHLAVD